MRRTVLLVVFAVVFLGISGCTQDPPDELLAPGTDGLSASEMVRSESPGKLPAVWITLPVATGLNPAVVPPVFYVKWIAESTKSVRWILLSTEGFGGSFAATEEYIRTHADAPEWSEWTKYKPKQDRGTAYYPPPQDYGAYVFAIQARSPSGDVTDLDLSDNMRRLSVAERATGA